MGDDFPDDLTVDAEILVHDPDAQADDKGPFDVATPFAGRILSRWLSARTRLLVLTAAWVAFYAAFFARMPS